MGRATVRATALAYLQAQRFPFVGTIFPSRPIVVDEADYDAQMIAKIPDPPGADSMSSAIVVVNLPDSHRERRTLSGRGSVDDTNVHQITLEAFFANRSGDGIAAQADHDQLVDAMVVALRADPTLGTALSASALFSAGEFQAGVHVQQHQPFTGADGTTIFIIATIRFDAWEWIAGTGV